MEVVEILASLVQLAPLQVGYLGVGGDETKISQA
jgi:hypothetical protein